MRWSRSRPSPASCSVISSPRASLAARSRSASTARGPSSAGWARHSCHVAGVDPRRRRGACRTAGSCPVAAPASPRRLTMSSRMRPGCSGARAPWTRAPPARTRCSERAGEGVLPRGRHARAVERGGVLVGERDEHAPDARVGLHADLLDALGEHRVALARRGGRQVRHQPRRGPPARVRLARGADPRAVERRIAERGRLPGAELAGLVDGLRVRDRARRFPPRERDLQRLPGHRAASLARTLVVRSPDARPAGDPRCLRPRALSR